jgi:16S rRNA C1402 N4-methylase RsmH
MHKPVLLNNIINKLSFLKQNPTQKYSLIDCTLGTAGHSKTLL